MNLPPDFASRSRSERVSLLLGERRLPPWYEDLLIEEAELDRRIRSQLGG